MTKPMLYPEILASTSSPVIFRNIYIDSKPIVVFKIPTNANINAFLSSGCMRVFKMLKQTKIPLKCQYNEL